MLARLSLLVLVTFTSMGDVHAQGTAADYARMQRLREQSRQAVYKASVEPRWLPGGEHFWYRNELRGGGREFVVVDCRAKSRQPAFDPTQLAARLSAATKRPIDPRRPPFAEIEWDPSADSISFDFALMRRTWSRRDAALSSGPLLPPPPSLPETDDSPRRDFRGRRGSGGASGRGNVQVRDDNLVLRDESTGETVPLTTDGTSDHFYENRFNWSPTRRHLVARKTQRGEEHLVYLIESSPRDQVQPKLHSYQYHKPGDKLPVPKPVLIDVAARKIVPVSDELFPNPYDITRERWSPDGSRFTFLYNQRGHQLLRLIEIDVATGAARTVVEERSPTFVDYAHKVFLHWTPSTYEIVWMSERDGWNHLYLIDAQSGAIKQQITRGEWVVRGVDRVDDERRQIWFRAGGIHPEQDPYHIHYCRVNFDGSGLTVLTQGDGTHRVVYSPDERYFVDTWSRVDLPPVTELRRTADGALVCELERADVSALVELGWRTPERFVAAGRDGKTPIYGNIYRPTNFDPAKRYPVIEQIYAGPHGSFVPKEFRALHSPQALCELGFITVQIDGMGTSNRSKAFHDVCWKNLGDSGFPDRIAWLKAAASERPEMDLDRVGIYGGSAGGQSALRGLLAHGDVYKVGVADCGCHDNRMDKVWWNELWMGWPVGPHYAQQSNVMNAKQLTGKLLLIVGELDRNVDPASTMQVANALIRADKDFDLLVIPGAGHGSAGSPYGQRRQQDFFVRHLLGVEPRRP
jgi:dipeptidyl aminopeptidase/acylaminoacyl peptidase